MKISVSGVKPYDGSYEFDFAVDPTVREWGWIKDLAGYLPLSWGQAIEGGDPKFYAALAVIGAVRAGAIQQGQVAEMFERLLDAPFGSGLTLDFSEEEQAEEDDAGPPPSSSNGSESSSGTASRPSSETSPWSPTDSGMPGSGTSEFDRPTSVS